MLLKLQKLQQIKTNEGVLFPIYKDWEEWHGGYDPKMVYATTLNPGAVKGPILHKKRRGLITAIQGIVVLQCKIDGEIHAYFLRHKNGTAYVFEIPAGVPFTLENQDPMLPAIIINCPDRAWHPDDEDTIKYDSWDDVP